MQPLANNICRVKATFLAQKNETAGRITVHETQVNVKHVWSHYCKMIHGYVSTHALFSHLVLYMLKSVTFKSPFYAKEQIDTSWPPGALPRRLACAPDGSNVMLAAASRFGLFQAELMQRSGFEQGKEACGELGENLGVNWENDFKNKKFERTLSELRETKWRVKWSSSFCRYIYI